MAFLFKRNPKTPGDLVKILNEQVTKLDQSNGSEKKKAQDEATRHLITLKSILNGDDSIFGESAITSQPEILNQLSQEIYSCDILSVLITNLADIEFDSRKIVVLLFNSLLKRKSGNRSPTVDYLVNNPKIITLLMRGPELPEVSLNYGIMLREALKHEVIAKIVIYDPLFWKYFTYVNTDIFEISTDSFATLKDSLTIHEKLVGAFFSNDAIIDRFITSINHLMTAGNYVTKRESTKLLADLIMIKANYKMMSSYVNNVENLKIIMLLLGDRSKNIQIEGFNVFKVFVANPRKEKSVIDILTKNRIRLLEFLETFNKERNDDLFIAEKEYIIQQIHLLPKIVMNEKSGEIKESNLNGKIINEFD
ncbi:Hym1 protein [Pichia kluyveri]|uniref:Hym1 protein n=1 Tax=Pichia kluyveri TaxID=36015 RepID=A0AAV5R780_PICKL|nr:Hym1 protein [Pichia kluyveri]